MMYPRFVILAASCCLLSAGGLAVADTARTVQDINAVADTVNQVIQSPAGGLIPEPIRTVLLAVTTILGCLLSLWFKKAKTQTTAALKCVVQAVDSAGYAGDQIKKAVGVQMDATGNREQLNKVVDSVK